MNKEPKPRTSLSREKLLQAMVPVRDLIPRNNYDQFLDQVYYAIEIYLDLDEPSIVAKELREINRICQKPNYTLLNILENVSTTTKGLLEGSNLLEGAKPLSTLPDKEDKAGINALAQDIRQRIAGSGKRLSDRVGYRLIGPSKEGHPSKDRLSVLVSFVAAAYVSATGESYRRRWDADGDLPFHRILEVLFKALGIDASTDEAIKRQKKSMTP
ncbi:hypothetical protein OAL97_04525 [Paracoccaceae bacterium]|nr:hypothetical protein [Paracoccaceae bacterium]